MKWKLPSKDVPPVEDDGRRAGDFLALRDHSVELDLRNRAIAPEQTVKHEHTDQEWCMPTCPAFSDVYKVP